MFIILIYAVICDFVVLEPDQMQLALMNQTSLVNIKYNLGLDLTSDFFLTFQLYLYSPADGSLVFQVYQDTQFQVCRLETNSNGLAFIWAERTHEQLIPINLNNRYIMSLTRQQSQYQLYTINPADLSYSLSLINFTSSNLPNKIMFKSNPIMEIQNLFLYRNYTILDINQFMMNVINSKTPQTLLFLTFEEKNQSQITKDWSRYQYVPILGNNFVYEAIDPKLNKFISGSQITINRVNLTQQLTIEIKINFAQDISGSFILMTMQNNKQSKLIVQLIPSKGYLISIKLNAMIDTSYQTLTLNPIQAIITNNILHFSVATIYVPATSSNTQLIVQQYKNGRQAYMQNFTSSFNFQNAPYHQQQIILGSSSNNFTSYFNFLELKLSQGYLYVDKQQFTQNCETFLIDRCIFCQIGYVSDQGICKIDCDQTNYMQQYDMQQLKCVRICHTTCKTCLTTQPQICVSCAGIRLNPPLCTCPELFFDDNVSPDCIQYLPIQSVQIIDVMCSVYASQNCVSNNYPVPYLTQPQIIMNLQSIQQTINGEYQVWLQSANLTGFAFCCKAPGYGQFKVRALIIEPQFVKTAEGAQTSTPKVQIPQTNTIIPVFFGINSSTIEVSLYYDGNDLNLVKPLEYSFWKYSVNDCKNMQQYPGQYQFIGGQFIQRFNISTPQPLSAPYISLVQNFTFNPTATQSSYNFYSVGSDQLYFNSLFGLTKFEFVNLYASIACTSGVCNFYNQMMSLCNNNVHRLCYCQTLGYVQTADGCVPCSTNCQTCSSPTVCTTCFPQLHQSLIEGGCKCQINQFVNAQYVCQQCRYSCLTCSDSSSCLSCNVWTYRQLMSPDCICQEGYFDNGVDQMCQKCSPLCKTCNGATSLNCTSCNSDRTISNGVCLCSKGLYSDLNQTCQDCLTYQGMQQLSCQYADCFDKIYTPGEQCDDGNALPRDGCTNCILDHGFYCINVVLQKSKCAQCSPNCIQCPINKCQVCSTPYQLNYGFCDPPLVEHIVKINPPVCGNLALEKGEECDEPNMLCQNCKIIQVTEKQSSNEIQAYYTTLSKSSNLTVFISTHNFNCSQITVSIDLWLQHEFTYKSAFRYLSNGTQCTIALNLTKTIYTYNLVRINILLQTTRLLDLTQQEIIVIPNQQYYVSPSQTSQVQAVSSVNQGLTTSIMIAAPIALMTGGFSIFWSMLDVLAWLNQIYYINVNFPDNIAIVFQQPTWQMLNVIQVPNYLNQQADKYYTSCPDRYMQQGNDALLLNNLSSQLLLWIFTFGFYIFCKLYIRVIQAYFRKTTQALNIEVYEIGQKQNIQLSKNSTALKIDLKFPWKQTYRYCYRFQKQIKSLTIQTLNLQYLDFLSAIVLQFQFGFNLIAYFPVMISYCFAIIGIIICLHTFALAIYTSRTHLLKLRSRSFSSTYGCFVESINIENKVSLMYSYVNLIRKTLFIIVLVAFYYKPIIQASLCCMIAFTNVALIIYQNPFESRKQFLSIGVPDICLFCITFLCFILSVDDQLLIMNADQRFSMGWVMLTFIIIAISIQSLMMVKDQIEDIRQKINKLLAK